LYFAIADAVKNIDKGGHIIMAKKNQMGIFREILKEVRESPETREMADEHQNLYGTLSVDDLRMRFTI
jgi:hypothetical protein